MNTSYLQIFRAVTIDILPFVSTKRIVTQDRTNKHNLNQKLKMMLVNVIRDTLSMNIYTQFKYTFLTPWFLYLAIQTYGLHYIGLWFYILGRVNKVNNTIVYSTGLLPLLYIGFNSYVMFMSLLFFLFDLHEVCKYNGIQTYNILKFMIHRFRLTKSLYLNGGISLARYDDSGKTTLLRSYHILFDRNYNIVLLNDEDYNLSREFNININPFPHISPSVGTIKEYRELYSYTGTSVFIPIYTNSKVVKYSNSVYAIIPNILHSCELYTFGKCDKNIDEKVYFNFKHNKGYSDYLPFDLTVPYTHSVMISKRENIEIYERHHLSTLRNKNTYLQSKKKYNKQISDSHKKGIHAISF